MDSLPHNYAVELVRTWMDDLFIIDFNQSRNLQGNAVYPVCMQEFHPLTGFIRLQVGHLRVERIASITEVNRNPRPPQLRPRSLAE